MKEESKRSPTAGYEPGMLDCNPIDQPLELLPQPNAAKMEVNKNQQ